jgi:hypothetical protein
MKQQAYQGRSEHHFVEGDQVFLRLQPYMKTSLKDQHCQKLAPKFYGHYTVLKRVGSMAYQLALPSQSKILPVFHVSCLKKVIGLSAKLKLVSLSWMKTVPHGCNHKQSWPRESIVSVGAPSMTC